MEKEFKNLGEKIKEAKLPFSISKEGALDVKDVKESIKDLKGDIAIACTERLDLTYPEIIEIIDKHMGDRLK